MPTILRSTILKLEPEYSEDRISCILGGGTENSTQSFFSSTLSICQSCFQVAERISNFVFDVYCGSQKIADAFENYKIPKNVQIHTSIATSSEMYAKSKLIITRAGRNTLSELLYLGMPTIAFSVSDPHRGSEQNANLLAITSLSNNIITNLSPQSDVTELEQGIISLVDKQTAKGLWEPGNRHLLEIIQNL